MNRTEEQISEVIIKYTGGIGRMIQDDLFDAEGEMELRDMVSDMLIESEEEGRFWRDLALICQESGRFNEEMLCWSRLEDLLATIPDKFREIRERVKNSMLWRWEGLLCE